LHPSSKRSPSPEYALRTGDFEAIPASHGPQAYYGQSPYGSLPQGGYGQPMRAVPPAPASLAPVAMSAEYTPRSFPTDRGVAHTSRVQVDAQRPTWRTGAMILLAGVFVGGTFGVGVQARRNAMNAEIDVASAAVVAPAPEAIAAPVAQPAAPPTAVAPAPVPTVLPQALVAAALPPGAIVIPAQPAVTVVAEPVPAKVASAPAPAKKIVTWRAPAPAKPGRNFVAAKVQPPPKAEKKVEKAAKVAEKNVEKVEKAEKAPKTATTDAQKVLADAIGETTHTL
jgi:hypothetical protein